MKPLRLVIVISLMLFLSLSNCVSEPKPKAQGPNYLFRIVPVGGESMGCLPKKDVQVLFKELDQCRGR